MFSIIVPVYNAEKFIEKCIKSVYFQSYLNYELLLIDDGSTDNSLIICNNWALKDKRIKVFKQMNQGASVARNKGIDNANGDYIIFLDSDDYWLDKNLLLKIKKRILTRDTDVLIFNYCKVEDNVLSKKYFNANSMSNSIKDTSFFIYENNLWDSSSWNKVIKKTLFREYDLKFIEGVTAEDIEWSGRLLLFVKKFDYIDLCGLAYVQHEGSVSSFTNEEKIKDLIENVCKTITYEKMINENNSLIIKQYLGYQAAIVIFNILQFYKQYGFILLNKNINEIMKYLKYSKNKKVIILNVFIKVLGLKNVLIIMEWMKLR